MPLANMVTFSKKRLQYVAILYKNDYKRMDKKLGSEIPYERMNACGNPGRKDKD
jgi:hypothetical protein